MSQPKHQLDTFRAWAGKSSDISYYLNSHHIDFHEWCVGEVSPHYTCTSKYLILCGNTNLVIPASAGVRQCVHRYFAYNIVNYLGGMLT